MSVASWRLEFYTSYSEKSLQEMTWLRCVEVSLLKWQGILPENLDKHQVTYCEVRRIIEDGSGAIFPFNGKTCPLCLKLKATPGLNQFRCFGCPISIYKALHKIPMENLERCACAEEYKRNDYGTHMRSLLEKIIKEQKNDR